MPAHRLGDMDTHCGGVGQLIEGSPDVIVGDDTASSAAPASTAEASGVTASGAETSAQEDVQVIENAFTSAAERGTPLIDRSKDCPCGAV